MGRFRSPRLACIIPTFNEASNVPTLVDQLGSLLRDVDHEIIFVDDHSPDGTADAVRSISKKDSRIRCVERIGRRGLSTAVIEGIMATSAEFSVVLDGDLQHDETVIPEILAELESGADLVVATRYKDGGGIGEWSGARHKGSKLATHLSRFLVTEISLSDPMSGFFGVRTQAFRHRAGRMTGTGYKVLLDFASTKGTPLNVKEVPYQFRQRVSGESKLDTRVVLEFFELLIAKKLGKFVPPKFVMFSLVGSLGVIVHFAVLSLLFRSGAFGFFVAQAIATSSAMTANFFANNIFTYFDRRLRGWKLLSGWLSFCAAGLVGGIANVGIAEYLFTSLNAVWYVSALAGILIGVAWNFSVTALYTWKV